MKDGMFNTHRLPRFLTFENELGLFIVLSLGYYKLKSVKSQQMSHLFIALV